MNSVAISIDHRLIATLFISLRTSHRGYEATRPTAHKAARSPGRVRQPGDVSEVGNRQYQQGLPDFFARFSDAFLIKAFVDAILQGKPRR